MIIELKINGRERKLKIDLKNEKCLVIKQVYDILEDLEKEENNEPNF